MAFTPVASGAEYSLEYRLFYKNAEGKLISPWHDIPLKVKDGVYNMVCEIPRWTNAKMEIGTGDDLTPIKQDVKKGKLRFVANPFPHKGYIWNYGALPQTWEDPSHVDPRTNAKGDNDPLDACEIGQRTYGRGEIAQVKVLGVLAMIDEGETDWKLIVIDVNDPLASKMNDLADVEEHMPGFLAATRDWFKVYKVADGKPVNEFAFNGEFQNREFAVGVIEETHGYWKKLVEQGHNGLSTKNTTLSGSPSFITDNDANAVFSKGPAAANAAAIPDDVDKWHYGHHKL